MHRHNRSINQSVAASIESYDANYSSTSEIISIKITMRRPNFLLL
jgi:hypothetical protein